MHFTCSINFLILKDLSLKTESNLTQYILYKLRDEFDPPIPSTLKPLVLLVVSLVAIQSLLNLINDWNKEPEVHTAADDIDKDEIERLKKSLGD